MWLEINKVSLSCFGAFELLAEVDEELARWISLFSACVMFFVFRIVSVSEGFNS